MFGWNPNTSDSGTRHVGTEGKLLLNSIQLFERRVLRCINWWIIGKTNSLDKPYGCRFLPVRHSSLWRTGRNTVNSMYLPNSDFCVLGPGCREMSTSGVSAAPDPYTFMQHPWPLDSRNNTCDLHDNAIVVTHVDATACCADNNIDYGVDGPC